MAKATWTVAEAKAKFSEVVQKAETEGPQRITRRGEDAVVVVSKKEWDKKTKRKRSRLEKWFADELLGRFEGRIFMMDGMAAAEWGVIMARGERLGHPISEMD